jgi:hypothetical protein
LVVEDVPLPIALPFGYFPSSSSYSSGILFPTWGDEMARGFSLRDGGYYFAFNDHVDLAIRGELYTKGSWGLNARSDYLRRYKFSGGFNASYLVTVLGDKDTKGMPKSDYSQSRDFRVNWSHRQDAKSNPYGTFSASVNFSTSSFNRNDYRANTLNQMSENTRASSVSYSYRSPTIPLSINTSTSINQRSRDSTMTVSLPDMTIALSTIYPFKRKEPIGPERWYEKIHLSYTGAIRNSINDVKEDQFFKKNMIKDWRNGMRHSIPVSASFNILKHINISTSFNYNENWYSNRMDYAYDYDRRAIVPTDTTYGFFRTYNYNATVSMNTKLYGMYQPLPLFGSWTKGVQIRHVFTPSIGFSGAPNFSDPRYGMFKDIHYLDISSPPSGNSFPHRVQRHPLFQNHLFGGPSAGRTGAMTFSFDNNVEAKVPVAGTDSTRKISIIENLGLRTSYNFLADSLNWAVINASLRLKIFGQNLSLNGNFDPYMYGENGRQVNQLRIKNGRGIGRFMGTTTSYSYTLNNESLKRLFNRGGRDSSGNGSYEPPNNQEGLESDPDGESDPSARTSLLGTRRQEGDYDADGYLIFTIPWSLSLSYSINVGYDGPNFNKEKREYPYKINQTLGFSGNISPTKSWSLNFNANYDFEAKRISSMFCSISRQMHCWSMSASIVPVGPYQNYSFTISVNSSLLQDVKYQQSSSFRDAIRWGH